VQYTLKIVINELVISKCIIGIPKATTNDIDSLLNVEYQQRYLQILWISFVQEKFHAN